MPDTKVRDGGGGGKWTPGEWRVFGDPEDVPGIDATLPDGGVLSIVVYAEPDEDSDYGIRGRDMSEAWANARLFVASRKMAEALRVAIDLADRRLADWPTGKRTPECQAVYDQCRAALALAEGGEG